jgi:hypothetical protein
MAENAQDFADVARAAILPAFNLGDLQTRGLQHIG